MHHCQPAAFRQLAHDPGSPARQHVRGHQQRHARVEEAAAALAATPKALVYLYWSELDKAGHAHGTDSPQWEHQLEELDAGMKRLAATVPPDTLILLTADHGMVDVPRSARIDYSIFPELVDGVRHTAGEPRMVHLYLEAGRHRRIPATG